MKKGDLVALLLDSNRPTKKKSQELAAFLRQTALLGIRKGIGDETGMRTGVRSLLLCAQKGAGDLGELHQVMMELKALWIREKAHKRGGPNTELK